MLNLSPRGSPLQFADLGFATVRVQRYSATGIGWTQELAVGMPKIDTRILDTTLYLYHSVENATRGANFGGTAFIVSVRAAVPDRLFMYAVTNWHVAVQSGASVMRINRRGGGADIVPLGPEHWHFDPKYDIAVAPISFKDESHARTDISADIGFVTKEGIELSKVGPGDDVFMVGRFVDHDGGPVNKPAVRFGNISVAPTPVMQENGRLADTFLIDMHSRSGYSGSPVFVYRTPGSDLSEMLDANNQKLLLAGTNLLLLLGIHSAQFPELWELGVKPPEPRPDAVPLVTEGAYVRGLSGMTCVLPAWCIREVLDMPKLKQQRDEVNNQLLAERAALGETAPAAEISPSPEEIAARRDAGLAKALATPPKPFTPAKADAAE